MNSKHKTLRGFQKRGGRASRAGNSALENSPSPLKRRIAGLGVGRPKGEEERDREGRDKFKNRGGERRDWQGKEGRTQDRGFLLITGGREASPHRCLPLGREPPGQGRRRGSHTGSDAVISESLPAL